MKKLIILILLFLFVIIGCQDDSSILAPDNDYASDEMTKGRPILGLDIDTSDKTADDSDLDYLEDADEDTNVYPSLSRKERVSARYYDNHKIVDDTDDLNNGHKFSVTEYVTINNDTELKIDESYKGGIHGEVKVIAKIKFYKGTVKENTNVTMTVNVDDGTLTFLPSMDFNQDVELYLKFEGLDLTNVNEKDIEFLYLAKDGTTGSVNFKEIIFDEQNGILEFKETKIPHFSRYGWTRTRT